jgi:hypothetical protein
MDVASLLDDETPGRAVGRPGVEEAPRGGHGGVPHGSLDDVEDVEDVEEGAASQGVGGVGVAQPVG